MDIVGTIRRHPGRTAGALVLGTAVAVAGFLWFRPDRLFTDDAVDEALPGQASAPAMADAGAEEAPAEAAPATLAHGPFISLEHQTTGGAVVLETEDGRRFLRFEDFETSNGPDLLVYLSAKEPAGTDDWRGYDQDFVDLGPLKGNVGNQNYRIPAGVDLDRYSTAVVWCRRFTVGFAAAVLS
ncbi:MAG: DM13 domain-containing protein [Actinomycetota bacterium]